MLLLKTWKYCVDCHLISSEYALSKILFCLGLLNILSIFWKAGTVVMLISMLLNSCTHSFIFKHKSEFENVNGSQLVIFRSIKILGFICWFTNLSLSIMKFIFFVPSLIYSSFYGFERWRSGTEVLIEHFQAAQDYPHISF